MAISSNFSILSDDVVVVGGASDVEVSLAVVVWNGNGSGWTLVMERLKEMEETPETG